MGANGPEAYLKPFYVQRVDSVDQVVANNDPRKQVSTGFSQLNLMQKIRLSSRVKNGMLSMASITQKHPSMHVMIG